MVVWVVVVVGGWGGGGDAGRVAVAVVRFSGRGRCEVSGMSCALGAVMVDG